MKQHKQQPPVLVEVNAAAASAGYLVTLTALVTVLARDCLRRLPQEESEKVMREIAGQSEMLAAQQPDIMIQIAARQETTKLLRQLNVAIVQNAYSASRSWKSGI